MNSWANEGDLVFVICDNEEIIPAKVIKEELKIPIKNTVLHLKPIEDNKTLPENKREVTLEKAGFRGGFVFRKKENATDYLAIRKSEGKCTMSSVINRKSRRNQEKALKSLGIPNIEQIKAEAEQNGVNKAHKALVSALLLAINSELGVGPKRAMKVIDKVNNLLQSNELEELQQQAQTKFKINIQ